VPALGAPELLDAAVAAHAGVLPKSDGDVAVGLKVAALGARPLYDYGALDATHDVHWLGLAGVARLDLYNLD